MKELVEYFDKTNVDWKEMTTSGLINFVFHTRLYLNNFHFAGKNGLDNFKSNIYTLFKEAKKELESKNIKFDF